MTELSLVARDVHITYRTYIDPPTGLRARLKTRSGERRFRDIEAVRGVSFELHRGESVGIIGHNGAGKSTILLGLAGLLELRSGEVRATSRPSLLGVGAVLHASLSGRRNMEMGCLALGMSRREIKERVDELTEFSGLSDFIDLPLQAYSAGMKARLAFTIATVATPDILLIDEALAVGDKDFRERAVQRLGEIRAAAGSVVIVSHNMGELKKMCNRLIWMDHGKFIADDDATTVIERYEASTAALDGRAPA